jgi:hypothetical protein
VTGGNAPLGRRDNGLYAAAYAVLAEVDPRVGEHLLHVLGDRGIAAYLKPTATLPHLPLDRLFVDRDGLTAARRLVAEVVGSADSMLAGEISELSEEADGDGATTLTVSSATLSAPGQTPPAARESDEFEAAWASIVAGFDHTAPADRPWPASEDVTPPSPPASAAGSEPATAPVERPAVQPRFTDERRDPGPSILDGLDTFGANLPEDEDDEDFTPPPPPPLPRVGMVPIIGVLGIVVGFLAVIRPEWFATLIPPATAEIMGAAGLLLGTVLLIGRLRSGSDEDDDPDRGAAV